MHSDAMHSDVVHSNVVHDNVAAVAVPVMRCRNLTLHAASV